MTNLEGENPVSDTAARKLYDLISAMNEAFQRASGVQAIEKANLGLDFGGVIVRVSDLVRETRDEIMRANFNREDRFSSLVDRLNVIQSDVMNGLARRGDGNKTGPLVSPVVVERALGIAEQIENAGVSSASTVTREDMMRETEDLISDVKEWDLEDYAKTTLLIQLNHLTRIIQAADMYSAGELRSKVKEIIADFASEFAKMDKKHQTQLERLVLWGRRGFFAGTILLGLTADVSAVTAALPAPPKLIGNG